jgi:integrase
MSHQPKMARLVKDYLAYRRGLGFKLEGDGRLLLRFAEYADHNGHRGPLTTELALRWARLPPDASPSYLAIRLQAVRGFARYRAIFDPGTEIPSPGLLGARCRRPTPHIYTEAEIAALLAAAHRLPPQTSLRPHTYFTFFGLLACTGLRLSEALNLTRSDVDWHQGLLTIRQTKFRKSRLVPLHPSATDMLKDYARLRDRFHPASVAEAFFVTFRGTPLRCPTVESVFGHLRNQLSWSARGSRRPRIHDLRHTFACRRLIRWYEEGADLEHAIAALSTYLGHAHVTHTYWYLTAVPDLLGLATVRFERFAESALGDKP